MKVTVFFDYACPFCLKGYEMLLEALKDREETEFEWCPCEAHPRPETYGKHSDLCIEGMYFAQDQNIDLFKYHELAYRAALIDQINIEDKKSLSEYFAAILDPQKLYQALSAGTYSGHVQRANEYAYNKMKVWAVPVVLYKEKRLDAIENIGIKKEALIRLFEQ